MSNRSYLILAVVGLPALAMAGWNSHQQTKDLRSKVMDLEERQKRWDNSFSKPVVPVEPAPPKTEAVAERPTPTWNEERMLSLERGVVALQEKLNHQEKVMLVGVRRKVPFGRTGAEACAQYGETCLGLSSSHAYDLETQRFYGYAVGTCHSQVIAASEGCRERGLMFAIDQMPSRWSSRSTIPNRDHLPSSRSLCLERPEYAHAICLQTGTRRKP